jgi:excisionase family DNA binding protein
VVYTARDTPGPAVLAVARCHRGPWLAAPILDGGRTTNYGAFTMVDETLPVAPGHLTVAEAAERLGITPNGVRALIASGELPATRLGRVLMIPTEPVDLRRSRGTGDGRRLVPANAWAVLFMAAGMPAPWIDRKDRWRLKHYLATHRLRDIRDRLVERGRPRSYRAHPSVLSVLRVDPALMLTGATGAAEARLGLLGGAGGVDAYVSQDALERVVRRRRLRPSREPNVTLRVVASFGVPWPPARVAPLSAIALDLLDSEEPRARQVGAEVLRGLDRD